MSSRSLHIVITIDLFRHWTFFSRFIPGLNALGHTVTVLTPMASVHLLAQKQVKSTLMMRRHAGQSLNDFSLHDVRAGKLDEPQARKLTDIYYSYLKKTNSLLPVDQIWLWNGASCAGIATKHFKKEANCSTRYFELGNFPGKIFVNPDGVNAQSSLFKDSSPLDYPCNRERFNGWKTAYLEEKLKQHDVKQSYKYKKIAWIQAIDLLFSCLGLVQLATKIDLAKTFEKKSPSRQKAKDFNISNYPNGFSFFPLQVKTDTQLTLNSKLSNLEAIKIAARESQREKLKLVVKPHPGERDKNLLDEVFKLSISEEFDIVEGNTFEIIRHSKKVIVINSTVGLEAMIMDKPATFLGRSFFSGFDSNALANYILDYLIDIDFFGSTPVDRHLIERILFFANDLPASLVDRSQP